MQKVLEQINSILYFSGHELRSVGKAYEVCDLGEKIALDAPAVKIIDRAYIKDLANRTNKNIEDGYFDSAITQARTIIEETFFYVIEKKGVNFTPRATPARRFSYTLSHV